ncbi:MAG: efflux RND transporter permease subunit [Candidatus Omnitrophica bacterium]|nr:efflux RND transporter permease subunit [Candidatus Omnitrophota bacterium]
MNIVKLSVQKPVSTLMVFFGIILLGIISWLRLPQALFPNIDYPQITVVTSYPNAAPEEIENLITKVIEETSGTVNNVKRINSISKEGLSLVMVEFNWGTNMDFAALNVREKIDLIKEKLPREAGEPIVMKYNPFDLPVMNLAVTGPMKPLDLRQMCKKHIKDALEKVEGVASATITGGHEREILVEINQPRLRASQISIVAVVDSIKNANINYPAGTIKETFYEYLIRTMGEYQTVEEIKETPADLEIPELDAQTQKEKEQKEKKGRRLIYLKDIAVVKDTTKEITSISRYNGKDSVSLVIRKQSGSNSLMVANAVKREIKKLLEEKLPKGVNIQITYDQSKFIKEALNNLFWAGIQGMVLAMFVLLLFLQEIKSALIITFAIPICVTATAMLMYFAKIDLNIMSLGGMAMGVGMVVDNANIVIENIFRHRYQENKPFLEAIIDGTNEMVGPIFGSTLTSIAVFLPFGFVIGIAGQIFKQLSFTISFSLITSIVVAISLAPVLISLFGKTAAKQQTTKKVQEITSRYRDRFRDWLTNLLDNKERLINTVAILFIIALVTLVLIEKQFLPRVDQRQFIIKVDLPPGSRLEITDSVVKKIEHLLLKLPETKDVTVNIGSSEERTSVEETALQTLGSHQAQLLVNLKPKSRLSGRNRSTDDVIHLIKSEMEKEDLAGGTIEYIAQETSLGSAVEQGAPLAIAIKGPNLVVLNDISSMLQSSLKKLPGVYGVKTNLPSPSPETKLHIRKDKASLFGLSVRDIAVTAQVALKGYVATKYKEKLTEEEVDIRVRLRPEDRANLGNLRRLLIHSPLGFDVYLSDVAFFTQGTGPTEIRRIDQQRSIMVTANIYKRSFNKVIAETKTLITQLQEKAGKEYSIELAGEQKYMQESFQSLIFALILAFVLVYMIMAAEFESLWQPFLIMFTIPLSIIGVAFGLLLTATPLSSVAFLGIIMLGGIAVNNGIVLIDCINQLRKKGYSCREAVITASVTRLRPILMTSFTTILGLLPLSLGIGEGSELQRPLAITVMSGLSSSTFLTLVFIPALYLFITERFEEKLKTIEIKPMSSEDETSPKAPLSSLESIPSIKDKEIISEKDFSGTDSFPKQKQAPLAHQPKEEPLLKEESEAKKIVESPSMSYSSGSTPLELNPRQQQLIEKLKIIKKITRKEYAEMFSISIPTASRDLKELVDKHILRARGPLGPGRWYELY